MTRQIQQRTFAFALLLAASGFVLSSSLLEAGTNSTTSAGVPIRWPQGTTIRFIINPNGVPGFTGELERLVVAGGVRDAYRAWTQAPGAALAFSDLGLSADRDGANDGISLISFTPTTFDFPPGVLAVAGTRFLVPSGQIVDADIMFNPAPSSGGSFSPVSGASTIDLVSVAVHEIGHSLGLNHSGVNSAIMKASVTQTDNVANRRISSDDAVMMAALYPVATFAASTGSIAGVITSSTGTAIRSAHAVAVGDPSGVMVASQMSDPTGAYRIDGLPPGNYRLLVEPLDGPANLSDLPAFYSAGVNDFATTFFGGTATPATLNIAVGQTATANVVLPDTPPALLNFDRVGQVTGTLGFLSNNPLFLPRGTQQLIVASETTRATDTTMRFGAPEITLSGSTGGGTLGTTPIRAQNISIPASAPLVTSNITLSNAGGITAFVGGATITVNPQMASPLRDGAGFGTALAPGAFVSIFSTATQDLAPSSNSAQATPLPTELSNVSVRINNRFAPLFFAGPGQINALVPFETTGTSANITVLAGPGAPGNTVIVPLSPTAPGIFALNQAGSGQGAILNPDSSFAAPLNSVPGRTARPTRRNDVVIIFASGLGRVAPALPSGLPAGISGTSIPTLANLPTVRIGGQIAPVEFAGLAPGFVGLYQVNVRVPAGAPLGDAVNLQITTFEGQASNTVTIAIGP